MRWVQRVLQVRQGLQVRLQLLLVQLAQRVQPEQREQLVQPDLLAQRVPQEPLPPSLDLREQRERLALPEQQEQATSLQCSWGECESSRIRDCEG